MIFSNVKQENRALKKDNIQKAIIEDLPTIFSKEDIKKLYPTASDSTIVRALNALKDKNYIIPLSSGRAAKWKRLVNADDLIYILGDNNDNQE